MVEQPNWRSSPIRMNLDKSLEKVDSSVFIASTATVTGDVTIGARSSIWFSAVVRADRDLVVIGEDTNVQDGAVLHQDVGAPVILGRGVTIGHGAIVHGARVGDYTIVGMGAILLSGSVIEGETIIGAGAVVTGGTVIPPRSMVLGIPGKVIRQLTDHELAGLRESARTYVELSRAYKAREER